MLPEQPLILVPQLDTVPARQNYALYILLNGKEEIIGICQPYHWFCVHWSFWGRNTCFYNPVV